MMKSEFIERTGFEPTAAEYEAIEEEYMGCDIDKDQFCKEWKKNGGIQRLSRQRVRKIEELEAEVAKKDCELFELDQKRCEGLANMRFEKNGIIKKLEERNKYLEEQIDDVLMKLGMIEADKKLAEDQLATVKAAFAILGIGKEEIA